MNKALILLIAILSCISITALNAQMGETIGTETMRQELESAEEEKDVYDESDSVTGPRYDEKQTEKVNEEEIEETPEGPVNEMIEEEETFTEEKYESSTWIYVILVIAGLLAIFAFYRYKIGKGK